MKTKPLISIVTPSFNQGKFLEEMIISFISQEYPEKELIIIDGGSTDGSVEIIKRYENHIAYWISEPDGGQTDALIKGLQKCKGQIFNWINSDDKLHPKCLENVSEIWMKNNGEVDLIAGNIIRFNQNDKIRILHQHIDYWNNIPKTLGFGQMAQPGMFYRCDLVKQIRFCEKYQFSMDIDLFTRYIFSDRLNYIIVKSKIVFAEFRLHSESKTNSQSLKVDDSAFFFERLQILFYLIIEMGDELSFKKLSKLFPEQVPQVNFSSSYGNVCTSKLRLLRSTLDYFLFQQFMKFLFDFNKAKIISLIRVINWTNIELSLIFKVVLVLNKHFFFFLKSKILG